MHAASEITNEAGQGALSVLHLFFEVGKIGARLRSR